MDFGLLVSVQSIILMICLVFAGLINSVSLLEMVTEGKVYVENQGASIVLSCRFISYGFNLFSNPVKWKKTQRGESMIMHYNSNIKKPFLNTKRFGVTLHENPPQFEQQLSIMNLAQEDSGNYTCEIRGPESNILAQVTHYLFVRAHAVSLAITNRNTTNVPQHRNHVTFNEVSATPNILRCVSIGGYPPPEMRVYIGSTDISDRLNWYQTPTLQGEKGLRVMTYYSERSSYNFRAEPQYDGMEITCAVNVPGYGDTNHTLTTMHVNYIPIIECFDNSAKLDDDMVHVTCDIRAKPPVKSSHWVLDNNGTIMSVPSVMNQYWTLEQNRSDGVLRSTLYWKKAIASSFRSYQLVAENIIGVNTHAARLIKIISRPTKTTYERDPPRTGYKSRNNYYVYKPRNGSILSNIAPSCLSTLMLSGTVLFVCKYLHIIL